MPTSAPVSTLASIEKITISLGTREGSDFAFYEKKYTLKAICQDTVQMTTQTSGLSFLKVSEVSRKGNLQTEILLCWHLTLK